MFVKAINIISKSVFPIFFEKKEGNQFKIGVVGTGFFFDEGLFITASHLVEDVGEDATLLYLGNVPHNKLKKSIKIKEIKRDSIKDLFVGKIEENGLPSLKIAENKPPVGKSLCMCGYPLAVIVFIPPSTLNVDNVRIYYQPTFVLDGFKGEHSYKGMAKKWEGFVTRDISYPGMSGGPVFDEAGFVHGMDVGTLDRTINREPNPIHISNGVSIGADVLLEFIKKL